MITAIVQFSLPGSLSREQTKELFAQVAGQFRDIPGLVRKYFLLSEDGTTGGGVYLWESRQAAERFYAAGLLRQIAEQYGSEPSVFYFESPVIVENAVREPMGAG
ncbi:YdhR family protein [Gloeobacter morelensis]|uniref:YdhR family protein n=1 Tax=Gloeobacter morelensis MG652769 TaxID=2781736 RepID=A0ABY3PN17_9CYAN|nr:YdhR family protein [Gloeobacter morelensis]UFP94964.1 YdhR family protein [Gloeobacter morelensis MG652769]